MRFTSKVIAAPTATHYCLDTACFSVEVNPLELATYYSKVEVADLDQLSIAIVESKASVVQRRNDEISSPAYRRFSIMYVVDGALTVSHQHRMTSLGKGEFTFIDNSKPRTMFVYDHVTLLLICTSYAAARAYLPDIEDMIARVFRDPAHDAGHSAFQPLLGLWPHLKEGKLEKFEGSLCSDLLRGIGMACPGRDPSSSHVKRLIKAVEDYIEKRLDDYDFRVEEIAAYHRVSSRYLRSLFKGEKNLSQYIRRRRIEKAASLLAEPGERGKSITEIAFDCGFSSNSCLTRSFKDCYGESPREFRQRHLRLAIH